MGHFDRRSEKEANFGHSDLVALLTYDPETGLFRWRVSGHGRSIGRVAGSRTARYTRIHINGVYYLAHRLAWLYVTGVWPSDHIDHVDRNGFNNRFSNLRCAGFVQNQGNRTANRNTKSGVKGVRWYAKLAKWQARISVDSKSRHLGYFEKQEDAIAAYRAASQLYFGRFARVA